MQLKARTCATTVVSPPAACHTPMPSAGLSSIPKNCSARGNKLLLQPMHMLYLGSQNMRRMQLSQSALCMDGRNAHSAVRPGGAVMPRPTLPTSDPSTQATHTI